MKRLLFLSFVAAIMVSCGMEVQKTGPEYAFELVKSDSFENVDTSKLLDLGGVKVQGDYVAIQQLGKYYDYKINSVKSYETVTYGSPQYYTWVFEIEKVSPAAFTFECIMIKKYMDEYLKPDPELADYVNIFERGGRVYPYDIKGSVDIPRHYLKNYDETKLPELQFTNVEFSKAKDCNPKNIPAVIANAKNITVKGTKVDISDGKNNVSLDIYPCSDREYIDEEYYNYDFFTKPTADCPKLLFQISKTNNPDDGIFLLVDNKDANDFIGGFDFEPEDFKTAQNLKRNICVCHPDDDDYAAWQKAYKK